MTVPKTYWGEAILIASYLINRIPTRVLDFKSLIEKLHSLFPNFQGLGKSPPKIFDWLSYVHVHSHLRGKLDP